MSSFLFVRDESREASDEVRELQRLLAEAEARRDLVVTGQGDLSWWSLLYTQVARWVWGDPAAPSQSSALVMEWPRAPTIPTTPTTPRCDSPYLQL
jgi:hypothetical protein